MGGWKNYSLTEWIMQSKSSKIHSTSWATTALSFVRSELDALSRIDDVKTVVANIRI